MVGHRQSMSGMSGMSGGTRSEHTRSAGAKSLNVLLPGRGLVAFQDLGHWCLLVEIASSRARAW